VLRAEKAFLGDYQRTLGTYLHYLLLRLRLVVFCACQRKKGYEVHHLGPFPAAGGR